MNDGKSEAANSGQCLATFGQGSPSRLARGLSRKALARKAEYADLGIAEHAGYLGQAQAGVAEILTSEIGAHDIEDLQKTRHSVLELSRQRADAHISGRLPRHADSQR